MKNEEEISLFEDALSVLSDSATMEDIPKLCSALDDNTHESSAMFGLVHLIERFCGEKAIELTIYSVLSIMDCAYGWAMTITKRILNSYADRAHYKKVFSKLDDNAKNAVVKILVSVRDDNPGKFTRKVNEIIQ